MVQQEMMCLPEQNLTLKFSYYHQDFPFTITLDNPIISGIVQ